MHPDKVPFPLELKYPHIITHLPPHLEDLHWKMILWKVPHANLKVWWKVC